MFLFNCASGSNERKHVFVCICVLQKTSAAPLMQAASFTQQILLDFLAPFHKKLHPTEK